MITRRNFMQKTAAIGAGVAAASLSAGSWSRVMGANDEIRMGVIGFKGKGAQHIDVFHGLDGVRVVALCDADQAILDREASKFNERGESVATFQDMRELLDQKDIDAVCIAAPNHWHSLAGIWACQAGKDVYVEKPISHNIFEGRQLIKAARKYNRIVQSGTQNRSDVGLRAFKEYLDAGNLGRVKWAHGLWFKRRTSIGDVAGPQPIPSTVDYNLWTGPASLQPLRRENLHYDWHWIWDYGNGDMANIGVHQIDDCRFLAGLEGNPRRAISFGGRWGYEDDGQTPNTHVAVFEYDIPLVIEIRNLPMSKDINAMDNVKGVRMGNVIMGEEGYFAGGRGGGWVYDLDGKKVKQFPGDGGGGHQANFIQAVRERNGEILNSPIEQGHYSSVVCHMANTSYRVGRESNFESVAQALQGLELGVERMQSMQEHLKANEINVQEHPVTLGADLRFDPEAETFVGDMSYEANMFVSRNYREPFEVTELI